MFRTEYFLSHHLNKADCDFTRERCWAWGEYIGKSNLSPPPHSAQESQLKTWSFLSASCWLVVVFLNRVISRFIRNYSERVVLALDQKWIYITVRICSRKSVLWRNAVKPDDSCCVAVPNRLALQKQQPQTFIFQSLCWLYIHLWLSKTFCARVRLTLMVRYDYVSWSIA